MQDIENNIDDIEADRVEDKFEWLSLIIVVIFAFMIRIFVLELFFVPTGSMKATILEGDYIFSTKYSYGYSKHSFPFSPNIFSGRIMSDQPNRGDVVIMRPPHNMDIRYIKRLIGLPGDKIELKNNLVYINDVPIKRTEVGGYRDKSGKEYIKYKEILDNGVSYFAYKLKDALDNELYIHYSNFGPYIVPNNHYFFLGDNRDESGDSRAQLGVVPFENLISKGRFVIFSTEEFLFKDDIGFLEQMGRIWIWIKNIRFNRMFTHLEEEV